MFRKTISENEKRRTRIVYPSSNSGLVVGIKPKNNKSYELQMKKLTPMNTSIYNNAVFTESAKQMLVNQLHRLHLKNETHSNLRAYPGDFPRCKVRDMYSDIKTKDRCKFEKLMEQIVVDYNPDTKKVTAMYLIDFDQRKTRDTKTNERKLVNTFISYLNSNTPFIPLSENQFMFDSPPTTPRR